MIDIPVGVVDYYETGSSVICEPPVTDTDKDIVLYVFPEDRDGLHVRLLADGWERGGSRDELDGIDGWASFKKKHTDDVLYNFIVTTDTNHYSNMYLATKVAKKLNLLNKEDRIMLFNAFIDGKFPEENPF